MLASTLEPWCWVQAPGGQKVILRLVLEDVVAVLRLLMGLGEGSPSSCRQLGTRPLQWPTMPKGMALPPQTA